MRPLRRPEAAVFFTGLLYGSKDVPAKAEEDLKAFFGPVFFRSVPVPWNHTTYYEDELGSPIMRSFIFFEPVVDPSNLPDAKLACRDIEIKYSREGKRTINIDPGYMTLAKVVLSSAKNYSHRIYLGKNIYAELELFFIDGVFKPLPYTYFDYKKPEALDVFSKARDMFRDRLAALPA